MRLIKDREVLYSITTMFRLVLEKVGTSIITTMLGTISIGWFLRRLVPKEVGTV